MGPKRLWRANVKRRKDINVEFIEHALNPNPVVRACTAFV